MSGGRMHEWGGGCMGGWIHDVRIMGGGRMHGRMAAGKATVNWVNRFPRYALHAILKLPLSKNRGCIQNRMEAAQAIQA